MGAYYGDSTLMGVIVNRHRSQSAGCVARGGDKSLNVSLVNTPLPSVNFVSIFPWQIDVIDETKIENR